MIRVCAPIVGSEKVKKSVDRLLEIFQIERGTGIRPIMVSGQIEH